MKPAMLLTETLTPDQTMIIPVSEHYVVGKESYLMTEQGAVRGSTNTTRMVSSVMTTPRTVRITNTYQ